MSNSNHPHATVATTPTTTSSGFQSTPSWTRSAIIAVFLIATIVLGTRDCRSKTEQRDAEIAARPVTQIQSPTLELRYECEIPCTRKIDFRYSFRGDGHDLKVTHPGIKEPVIYKVGAILQEDDPHLKGLEKGMTTYDAVDPALHKCRIQVFEKKGIWP